MRKTAVLQRKTTVLIGGLDWNRTSDTRIFNVELRIYVSINQWLTYSIWQRVIKRVIETHQKTTFPQDHSFHLLHLLHL